MDCKANEIKINGACVQTSKYGWIVTKENFNPTEIGLKSRVGWVGPRNVPMDIIERLKKGEGKTWRVRGDGEEQPDYEGLFIGPQEEEFGPLDDLGKPDVGAVIIEYKEGKKWVML